VGWHPSAKSAYSSSKCWHPSAKRSYPRELWPNPGSMVGHPRPRGRSNDFGSICRTEAARVSMEVARIRQHLDFADGAWTRDGRLYLCAPGRIIMAQGWPTMEAWEIEVQRRCWRKVWPFLDLYRGILEVIVSVLSFKTGETIQSSPSFQNAGPIARRLSRFPRSYPPDLRMHRASVRSIRFESGSIVIETWQWGMDGPLLILKIFPIKGDEVLG